MYDDLAIIITADHGENFGELGVYSEHGTADEPTCHIPLIIKWPGVRPGSTDRGFHYLLDLAPTVADFCACRTRRAGMDSLLPRRL